MNLINTTRLFNAIPPGVIKDDAAFVANVLDLADFVPSGAAGIAFVVNLGAIDAAVATLKVMESDTETDSTTLGGTPVEVHDVTTKPGATDDNGIFVIYVPLTAARQRYLQLQATAGDGAAGTYLSAIAIADMAGQDDGTMGATSLEIASV